MTTSASAVIGLATTVIASCAANEVLLSGGYAGETAGLPLTLTASYNGRDYHETLNPTGDANAWRAVVTATLLGTVHAFANCLKVEDV